MMFPDIPPRMQETVMCSIAAANEYDIPANILLAVSQVEGGHIGQWVKNTNGTFDIGPMQFNTAYIRTLARYGITPNDAAAPGCYAFRLAAWRLRQELSAKTGSLWQKAANYHSRTLQYNLQYQTRLIPAAYTWAAWLQKHFSTYNVITNKQTKPLKDMAYASNIVSIPAWIEPSSHSREKRRVK